MCFSRQHSDCTKLLLFLLLLFMVFIALLQCSIQSLFFCSSALHHVTLESLCNSCFLAGKSINFNECFCTKGFLALGEKNESKDDAEYRVGNLQDKQKGEKCLGKGERSCPKLHSRLQEDDPSALNKCKAPSVVSQYIVLPM